MRLVLALTLALSAPAAGFAAGGDNGTPPKTTKSCKGTQVWDEKTSKCVNPQESQLDSDTLYGAVRELAYAGRYVDAQNVLRVMADQNDDRVLTYWGFTHRKLGNSELARSYYERAIADNPDNLLARSYMGQGFIADGNIDGALAQWREIKQRGGEGTWAEASLRTAIGTGKTYNY